MEGSRKLKQQQLPIWMSLFLEFTFATCLMPHLSRAESLCATVKIEIAQELTLERQAFDARMRISNGLDTLVLENISVDVNFADDDDNPVLGTSNPNDTNAAFFIRVDSLEGISDVDGTGSVPAASAAEIHWLIIPASGAAGGEPHGRRYQVGATIRYVLGGEEKEIEVEPDWITVTPQPLLTLDYFLERHVFADEPFTIPIEPPEPFTLGVRVRNDGFGIARSVAIDSAQPKIVENDLGLLIGFFLTGSFVDDQPTTPTLRIDFGNIDPQRSRVGRWVMETTLSGQFIDFSADFSHSDELGGRLTSLIDSVNTHFLVKDVRVDLPGRDGVRDFLACDSGSMCDDLSSGVDLRVYESESVDTTVTDRSSVSTLTPLGGSLYSLTTPLTAGPLFVRLQDPTGGTQAIRSAVRADGKLIPSENAWSSKTGDANDGFEYFVNLFDVNGGGQYTLEMGPITPSAATPVIQFVPDRAVEETQNVSFIVEASDPNGTIPSISALALPVGATFVDQGNGVGVFDWTPAEGQAGSYPITYRASDGVLSSTRTAFVHVTVLGTTVTPTNTPIDSFTPTPTNTPTPTGTPVPATCAPSPVAGCQSAGKGIMIIKDKEPAGSSRKDKLVWKWVRGPALTQADFGDPISGATGYVLCIYDSSGLQATLHIPAEDGSCGSKPCWKALSTKGFKYKDKLTLDDGVLLAKMKAGDDGRSKALVKAKDGNLPIPALPLDDTSAVTVQLVRTDTTSPCFETVFNGPAKKNTETKFKAKFLAR